MSKGEERIISLLQKGKYKFEREKRFSDLKKGRYRFDFYVVSGRAIPCVIEYNGEGHYQPVRKFYSTRADIPCVIEYNGEGHYQPVRKFYSTRAEFVQAQERDRRKISYCLAHNIPLYIIPYWELNNIHTAADLFNPRFRATSKWKNDLDWQRHKNLTGRR